MSEEVASEERKIPKIKILVVIKKRGNRKGLERRKSDTNNHNTWLAVTELFLHMFKICSSNFLKIPQDCVLLQTEMYKHQYDDQCTRNVR